MEYLKNCTNGRDPEEFASAVYKVAMRPYTGGMLLDEQVLEMSPSNAPLDLYV